MASKTGPAPNITIAEAFKVLFERQFLVACYDLFDSDLPDLTLNKLTTEPGEQGLKITFNDGSVAFYDDGDYWLEGEKQWCGSYWTDTEAK